MSKRRKSVDLTDPTATEIEEVVFVVYKEYHYDCYKRAETTMRICQVFTKEEAAYEYCFLKQVDDLEEYVHPDMDVEHHKTCAWLDFVKTLKNYHSWKEAWEHLEIERWYPAPDFTHRPSGNFFFVKPMTLNKSPPLLSAITLPPLTSPYQGKNDFSDQE